uniref:RanBD1 domain-containing protein n=1 Tax=Ciona savignyi TaxID=51511 RepID=H2Z2N7_CIOSA
MKKRMQASSPLLEPMSSRPGCLRKQREGSWIKRRHHQLEPFQGLGAFGGSAKFSLFSKKSPTLETGSNVEVTSSDETNVTQRTNPKSPIKDTSPLKRSDAISTKKEKTADLDYNHHLSALNKSVTQWIVDHVEKNPVCDLTPIFKDYQKHLSDIEDKYGSGSQSECDSSQSSAVESSPKPQANTPLQPTNKPLQPASAPLQPMSTPLQPTSTTLLPTSTTLLPTRTPLQPTSTNDTTIPTSEPVVTSPPVNPLGAFKPNTASPFKGFGSFGTKPASGGFTGFQFANSMVGSKPVAPDSTQSKTTPDDDYTPPKNETQVVKEDGAFYTKKCKLFYMKGNSYADKGVGHLHLKPVESSSKTQLIVRADTSLGNLLLNILLNSAMPVGKQGKNNVSISCIPNPPIDEDEP